MEAMDTWRETWDWAEAFWGENTSGFYQFFRLIARHVAEYEQLEEVGSSDVWHLSYWAVQYARKDGVDSAVALMESVADLQGVYLDQKAALILSCAPEKVA